VEILGTDDAVAPAGWTTGPAHCEVEQERGSHPFYATHCSLQHSNH